MINVRRLAAAILQNALDSAMRMPSPVGVSKQFVVMVQKATTKTCSVNFMAGHALATENVGILREGS